MLDIAGVTVGAAFVGAYASSLVLADLLRLLHEGENYSVIASDLRNPIGIEAIKYELSGRPVPLLSQEHEFPSTRPGSADDPSFAAELIAVKRKGTPKLGTTMEGRLPTVATVT